jgi:hypothetical protein
LKAFALSWFKPGALVGPATFLVFFATAATANIVATRGGVFDDLYNAGSYVAPNFSQIINCPKGFAIHIEPRLADA